MTLFRRFRLSVRALMVVVIVLGSMFGLVIRHVRVQREVVVAIETAGGRVYWQRPRFGSLPPRDLGWVQWGMTRVIPSYFGPVVSVFFESTIGKGPDDAVLEQIARLESVEEIDFSPYDSNLSKFPSHTSVKDSGLVFLRRLPRLRRLNLSRTGISGPGLANLAGIDQLRELELWDVPTRDDDLGFLKGLVSLECWNSRAMALPTMD